MTIETDFMSATELLAGYAARELSPVVVTECILERIEHLNPYLNAFCLVDAEGALTAARASERRWRNGVPQGALDGIPVSVKDLILTKSWPTLRGSRTVDPSGPWLDDAPAVARLRESGAVILGKTATPEFGWKGVTDGALGGITRNPWNLERTPGGSSGGAAAQLAAGLGPLALGTDGGGSIRIPAAFSGVSGLKPNFGRVPAWPLSPMGTVAHLGPMARSVEDCALALNVLAQPDARDWFALPYDNRDWRTGLALDVKGLRIAYSPRLGYVKNVDTDVERCVADAVRKLEELGARIEEADPGFADCREIFWYHWTVGAYNALRSFSAEQRTLLEPGLLEAYRAGEATRLATYLDAVNARAALGRQMREFHERFDVLVTPTLPLPAFEVGRVTPDVSGDAHDWTWWTPFTFPFNLTQQPALSVPCGFTRAGLPVGLQLVAANFREDLVLRAGYAYQTATDHHRARPPLFDLET
jgi:aspartyl-tRNA(Asn)/glutamyl-tRNA(Gln) amidotransferase subunit A